MDLVQPKDQIIIKQGTDLHLHQLTNKPRFQGTELDNIIGKPFWSVFRREQSTGKFSTLVQCDPQEMNNDISLDHVESGVDNRNIQDTNDAQSLTRETIVNMKDEGASSQEIMLKLVENSATFSHKTEYAQQKYLRKKSKKYTDYIQVLKPNLRLLTEIYLRRTSSPQLLGMRVDTLAQIVTLVNLHPDGTYLVYENNCEGLVIATMLNALSKNGKVVNIVHSKYPFKFKVIKALGMTKDNSHLVHVDASSFLKYSKTNECELKSDLEPEEVTEGTLKRPASSVEQENKKRTYHERNDEEVRLLMNKKADGLVIACKQLPNEFLKELLQFLAPSKSFVIYSQYQEPLIKLYHELRFRKDVICVRLLENWLRLYQILPNQTHPEITMSGSGGYLLTGITVLDG